MIDKDILHEIKHVAVLGDCLERLERNDRRESVANLREHYLKRSKKIIDKLVLRIIELETVASTD